MAVFYSLKPRVKFLVLFLGGLWGTSPVSAFAVTLPPGSQWFPMGKPAQRDTFLRRGRLTRVILPMFSVLLSFNLPDEFYDMDDDISASLDILRSRFFIHGEDPSRQSQEIVLTGIENLTSARPKTTAKDVANMILRGHEQQCLSSVTVARLPSDGIAPGWDACALVCACGDAAAASQRKGFTAIIVAIRGTRDFYTFQWDVENARTEHALDINLDKWTRRLRSLEPFRLCPVYHGEKPPYSDCGTN